MCIIKCTTCSTDGKHFAIFAPLYPCGDFSLGTSIDNSPMYTTISYFYLWLTLKTGKQLQAPYTTVGTNQIYTKCGTRIHI